MESEENGSKENALALVESKRLTLTIVNFMGSSMQVLALPTATLGNLKDIVEDAWNVPTEEQLLYHGNKLLSDDKLKLVDIGLKDGDSLKLRTKLNFLHKAKPQVVSRYRDTTNAKKQLNVVIKLTKDRSAKSKNADVSGTSEDDRRDDEKSKKVQPALPSPPGKPLVSRGERLGRELDARLANAKTKRRIYRFRQQMRLNRQASVLRRSKQCSFRPGTSTSSSTKPRKKYRRKFGRKHVFAEFVPKREFGRRAHSQVRIRCDCPTALSRKFRTQLRKHKDTDLQAFVEENREAWLRMRKERQSPETVSEPIAGSKPKKQRRRHCDFHTCPQRMMIFRKRSVQPRAYKGSGTMGGTLGFLKYVGLDWLKWQDERRKGQGEKGSPKSPKLSSDESARKSDKKSNSSQVHKRAPRRRRNDKDSRTDKL